MANLSKFSAALIVILLPSSCKQDKHMDKEAIKIAIQKELDICVQAVQTKDIDLFMQGISDEFIIDETSGETTTKEQLKQNILKSWAIIDTTLSNRYKVDSLFIEKDKVIAYTSQRWERIMFQRNGVHKDTVLTTQLHREEWVNKNNRWFNAKVVELGGDIYVNGKYYDKNH